MRNLLRLCLVSWASFALVTSAVDPLPAYFTINTAAQSQIILGLGYEVQSDSIGSGNNGMPNANTSVPTDLTPQEATRWYRDMLTGFRYCRLALGLYFRGTTPDGKNVVERWPGQAAGLADMAVQSGIEGFAVEYWSPPPAWKSTGQYIDGTLVAFDETTLDAFSSAVLQDAQYLEAHGLHVAWWGLQNEPAVGPGGCIYSCCGYNSTQYYLAFKAAAAKIHANLPLAVIHASSWSGPHWSPEISADPVALALVDAWTYHDVGGNSNDQIQKQSYYLQGLSGKPVLNNEFEYLDDVADAERTINTAQSIMNWLVFENAPAWYWLHALKPLGHAEAAGYALGYWNPVLNSSNSTPLPPGHWEYNPLNFNSVAGFTVYMPWDSVRLNVTEDVIRPDVRVLAYAFDPSKARWLRTERNGNERPSPSVHPGASMETLTNGSVARAAATQLAFVLTNRMNSTVASIVVSLAGLDPDDPLPSFNGHLYGPNTTDEALGKMTATLNATTGLPYLTATLQPYSIQFWVQE